MTTPATRIAVLSIVLLLTGCGGSNETELASPSPAPSPPVTTPPPEDNGEPIPDNRYSSSYQILLVGNSHVRSNNLGGLITTLIKTGTDKEAHIEAAPGAGYLDERLDDDLTQEALTSRQWSHVVLQAQKYSTSGQYHYSTEAAQIWIERIKAQQATPILFPEHPRYLVNEEGMRVFNLHTGIAEQEASCVAPIGPAWLEALVYYPEDILHRADGNHAALAGSLLTALVFYEVITGESADMLPFIPGIEVDEQTQQQLGQIASANLQQYPGCEY